MGLYRSTGWLLEQDHSQTDKMNFDDKITHILGSDIWSLEINVIYVSDWQLFDFVKWGQDHYVFYFIWNF